MKIMTKNNNFCFYKVNHFCNWEPEIVGNIVERMIEKGGSLWFTL